MQSVNPDIVVVGDGGSGGGVAVAAAGAAVGGVGVVLVAWHIVPALAMADAAFGSV